VARKRDRLKRSVYEEKLKELHFELVKMQYWIKDTGRKLVLSKAEMLREPTSRGLAGGPWRPMTSAAHASTASPIF